MTMYNEDEDSTRSMHGVIKNVAHLCKRDRSKTWGKEGWKKLIVCIVSDGRAKVNSRTLSVVAAMGCYQEGIAKTKIGERDVTANIYDYTTQVLVETSETGVVSVQVIFCLTSREKNQKKTNTIRWLFTDLPIQHLCPPRCWHDARSNTEEQGRDDDRRLSMPICQHSRSKRGKTSHLTNNISHVRHPPQKRAFARMTTTRTQRAGVQAPYSQILDLTVATGHNERQKRNNDR